MREWDGLEEPTRKIPDVCFGGMDGAPTHNMLYSDEGNFESVNFMKNRLV